jgi:Big-like domain-containing protein/CARDB protein/matrixin
MTRRARRSRRRLSATPLLAACLFVVAAVGLTKTLRASDNIDYDIGGQIQDTFWDSRLFDGTPGFSGAILWHYNPTGMPANLTEASFVAAVEASFNTWESVDDGFPQEPIVPVLNFGGQTTAADAFALDGVNLIAWKAEDFGGGLAVTPCWALDAPTTTTTDGTGHTVMPVDGGSPIPFPGPPGVTYPIGTVIDCGMQLDSVDTWSTTDIPDPFGFDVRAITTHEGGHFIGVSHSTLGDFEAINEMSATMLPFVASGDATYRTLEEDDKAAVLRVYARNRFSGPLPPTVGGRGVINLRLVKDGACVPATGVSVVAYRTASGIDGMNRVETFSGSQFRAFTAHQPFNGSVTLNVPPLPAGESYTIYARTLETGTGALSGQRYNYTTINSNLLDPPNQSRTFDQLATVSSLGAGDSVNLGDVGILGCWVPNPTSLVNLVAQSITAPATAYKGGQIAVSSTFTNAGSAAAGAFQVGVYFSTDQTITSSDIFSGFTCAVPGLAGGAVTQCSGSAPVPAAVVPGNYYVGLLVDRQNQVPENVESDNGVAAGNVTAVARNPLDPIVNGSFETGDLTGWTVKELTPKSNPNLPLSVRGAGVEYPAAQFIAWPYILDYFTSAPTDGQFAALNDFNGDDPATTGANQYVNRRELYQDITLPPSTTTLEFDYRAAWELFRFGSTQDRTFSVEIGPAGGGAPFLTQTILVAPNLTIEEDTDNPSGGVGDYPPAVIDLSAFATQSIRLKFVWNIPEPGTGFGFFQLDNIRLNTSAVPTNTAPTVTISAPGNGISVTAGQTVTFAGTATDTEDGNISASLSWVSSRDNTIGSGATFSTSALSAGTHTITASVQDSGGLPGSASITITVNPANTAPTAGNQVITASEDTPLSVTLSGSDAQQCELQFAVVTGPANGTLGPITNNGCAGGTPNTDSAVLTYTPGANFSGSDSFTYRVSDGALTANATVSITVNAVNDAPIAANSSLSTVVGTAITVVLGATDVETCELAFSVVQAPLSGSLGAIANDACVSANPRSDTARISYTPAATGTHTFTYKANDGVTDSNAATVTITVSAPPSSTTHVGDLDGSRTALAKGTWRATVSASVHDSNHAAVTGATVNGLWSGGVSGQGSCTTDATGRCSVPSAAIANSKKNATFTVTGVTKSGTTYTSASNHDTDGDSNGGTAITVNKP